MLVTASQITMKNANVNACDISVASFLELLTFYLISTFVELDGCLFLKKTGVCICSKVAPILSDNFLSRVDKCIAET